MHDERLSGQLSIIKPSDIERRSFEIIEKELLHEIPEEVKPVVKRVIHTTADFSYADTLCFSEGVMDIAHRAIREGAAIVTDTNMGKAGINVSRLAPYGNQVYCFMSDEDVALEAEKRGLTRAIVSMEKAAAMQKDGLIFAIGNAPTALVRLYELIKEGRINPALIIGVPVGFVNVTESKELIMQAGVPYIVARGRKGGSNVAAAICNALVLSINKK